MPAARLRALRARPNASAAIRTERARRAAARLLPLAALLLALAAPARAQLSFSGTIASDDRFRGESISGARPVATFSIAWDDVHGPYAGISFTAVAAGDGVEPLQSVQYAGYALRLKSGLSLDVGLTHQISSHYYTGEYGRDYSELYVGIVGRRLSTHLFFAPDQDGHGGYVYAALDDVLLDRGDWALAGHVGALAAAREPAEPRRTIEADGRLAATRRFGRTALSLALVGATPGRDGEPWHRTVLVSLTHSF